MRFKVSGSESRVSSLGFRVYSGGFGDEGYLAQGSGFRVRELGFWDSGLRG